MVYFYFVFNVILGLLSSEVIKELDPGTLNFTYEAESVSNLATHTYINLTCSPDLTSYNLVRSLFDIVIMSDFFLFIAGIYILTYQG
jgi:hypothetical protein